MTRQYPVGVCAACGRMNLPGVPGDPSDETRRVAHVTHVNEPCLKKPVIDSKQQLVVFTDPVRRHWLLL